MKDLLEDSSFPSTLEEQGEKFSNEPTNSPILMSSIRTEEETKKSTETNTTTTKVRKIKGK